MSRVKRVAVMSPQTRLARTQHHSRPNWWVPRLTAADTARARRLYRAQRGPGLRTLALMTPLCLLPLAFVLWPTLDEVRVLDIPLSWLMLGALPFPVMVAIATSHLRRAESIEDRR